MRRAPSKLDKNFANKIKEIRGAESQIKFAKRLGISQSTLNRIENIEQSATLNLIDKITTRLKINPKDLI